MVTPHVGNEHDDHDHATEDNRTKSVSRHEVLEQAIRELLIDKGVLTATEVHNQIDAIDSRNPALGARIVAKAWTDPDFKSNLIANPRTALANIGIDIGTLVDLQVVENTPDTHHVVVCTLCSCYPRMILGIPPAWYKSPSYRASVVADPRRVLKEFGTEVPESTQVRVHDSTADLRYLVLPMRPAGTEALSEESLAALVTRDCMIGTAVPQSATALD